MLPAIKAIDRGLKHLYNVDLDYRAEHFLVNSVPEGLAKVAQRKKLSPHNFRGALLVKGDPSEMSLGIYLDDNVKSVLSSFPKWKKEKWNHSQMAAFATAAEEVSHFHYLLFHAHRGRAVSQFELEFQGEIDKFFLSFFAQVPSPELFEMLYEKFFWKFHLEAKLDAEEQSRYQNASQFARRYVATLKGKKPPEVLAPLRKFYRLNSAEKISFVQSAK